MTICVGFIVCRNTAIVQVRENFYSGLSPNKLKLDSKVKCKMILEVRLLQKVISPFSQGIGPKVVDYKKLWANKKYKRYKL